MSVISRLYRQAERAEIRSDILRAKGTPRALAKARRLMEKAAFNREILNTWDEYRW